LKIIIMNTYEIYIPDPMHNVPMKKRDIDKVKYDR
jgi:hypothetical protein